MCKGISKQSLGTKNSTAHRDRDPSSEISRSNTIIVTVTVAALLMEAAGAPRFTTNQAA